MQSCDVDIEDVEYEAERLTDVERLGCNDMG